MTLDTVWTDRLADADAEDYDRFVAEAEGGNYVQGRAWARAATAGRPFAVRYFLARRDRRVLGAALVLRTRALGAIAAPFAQVERGPVCASPDDLPEVLASLVKTARAHGIARIGVMPYFTDSMAERAHAALRGARFKDVQRFDGAHAASLRLAIGDKHDDEILAGSEYKSLRYELKHAAKVGARARRGAPADVRILESLYAELMGSQSKEAKPRTFYDAIAEDVLPSDRGALFVCEHEGSAVSAVFIARHGRVATLAMAAATQAPKSFQKTVRPMMEAIRWARDVGCEVFDVGGIPLDGDTDEKRLGIARFKHTFAKTRVHLVHEHARWF
jgi:lipid II:glycine glycyltransferase (peptidoglycan interpeptide bridge formation enzyme)